MILSPDEEGKLNPRVPPPVYTLEGYDALDGGGERASESSRGQDAESSSLPSYTASPQPSTSTSYYAASPAGSSLASTSTHPAFSRPRASGLPYQAFQPTYLVAQGKSLDKGFPMIPPPSEQVPHPFVTHDVHQHDWLHFLDDLRVAGTLTQKDISRSHLPIISCVPIVNALSAYGVQKLMKSRKIEVVARAIDSWNHHFFEPRKMQVLLMKGSVKVSGLTDRPISGLHTPIASNIPPERFDQPPVISDTKTEKGKAKDDSDDIYRLFILPVS